MPCHAAAAADGTETSPLVSWIPVLASWHGLHSYPGAQVWIPSVTGGGGAQQTVSVSGVGAAHSSTLAWKIPWTEEPGRLQSMRSLRVGHD